MRKIKIVFYMTLMTIGIIACKDVDSENPISACSYTKTEKVSFSTAIRLSVSANRMSTNYYNSSGIYIDNFFSDLKTPLAKGDTGQTYRGQITVNLKSSGKNCSGDNTETIKGQDSKIGGNYIMMKVPSSVPFIGTATTSIRSDDWKSKNSISSNQYVSWVGTDNDPQYNGLKGNIFGSVKEYSPSAGKIVLQGKGSNKYIIMHGRKVYL